MDHFARSARPLRIFYGERPADDPPLSLEALHSSRRVIELAVSEVFGIEGGHLAHLTRGVARTAFARQVAMYLAHVACRMSLTEVGRVFGRDRTTVAHACRLVEDKRDNATLDRALDLLEWSVPAMAARPARYLLRDPFGE